MGDAPVLLWYLCYSGNVVMIITLKNTNNTILEVVKARLDGAVSNLG